MSPGMSAYPGEIYSSTSNLDITVLYVEIKCKTGQITHLLVASLEDYVIEQINKQFLIAVFFYL